MVILHKNSISSINKHYMDKQTFNAACQYANGAIIGSAYINALGKGDSIADVTQRFLSAIRD